jgi:hypothetical protein
MFTAQYEDMTDELIEEVQELSKLHYDELALDQDVIPYSVSWDVYKQHAETGMLISMTLRNKGELIGYYVGYINQDIRYNTCTSCKTDVFFIHKDFRMTGAGGVLFNETEQELKRRNVDRWFVTCKKHVDATGFLEKLEFELIEYGFGKLLGE